MVNDLYICIYIYIYMLHTIYIYICIHLIYIYVYTLYIYIERERAYDVMSCFRKYDTTTLRFLRCIEKMMRIACSGEESKQRLDVRHGMGGDGPRFPKRSQVGGETSPASLSFSESFFPPNPFIFSPCSTSPKRAPRFHGVSADQRCRGFSQDQSCQSWQTNMWIGPKKQPLEPLGRAIKQP